MARPQKLSDLLWVYALWYIVKMVFYCYCASHCVYKSTAFRVAVKPAKVSLNMLFSFRLRGEMLCAR